MAGKSGRRVPVELLSLSMPRTGSVSMKAAYEILGLPTYHGFVFVEWPEDQVQWEKAIDAKWYGKGKPFTKEDFDAFLGQWAVLSDFPVLGFTEEFLEMYPEAKVVLVERDIDKWYKSFEDQVIRSLETWQVYLLVHYIEPFVRAHPASLMTRMEYAMFNCKDQEGFCANAKQTYRDHYAKVRRLVPKERLLEYRLGSGWEPLCAFLNKPVPDEPFPFLNETKEFAIFMQKVQTREIRRGLAYMTKYLVLPGVVVAGAAWYLRKML